MKFYAITSEDGSISGCELTLREAIVSAKKTHERFSVQRIICDVNKETIRRLLGEEGGYASKIEQVFAVGVDWQETLDE